MLDEMGLRRAALGSLLLGFAGPRVPTWLGAALAEGLGGVVLFGGNIGDGTGVAALTDALRVAAGRPIVTALDEEGGDVTRLDAVRGSSSPGAAALGQLDDPEVTEEVYAAIGVRLAQVGVTADLAPVADVNSDPRNPVIGVRSFGADPQRVARHVAAAVRGIQRCGVAACVKHFPGHGATSADSHREVAAVLSSRAELERCELVPFRAAVAAGARCVMTGHLVVPALDDGPAALATVSAPITTGVLRGELGFDGVVMTDALEMRALADNYGLAEGVVAALAAGADAIETGAGEYPQLVRDVPDAVVRAVREGRLAAERVLAAAAATARLATPPTPAEFDAEVVAGAAARCVEVTGELPVLRDPLVIECRSRNGEATGALHWSLGEALAGVLPGVDTLACADAAAVAAAVARARTAERPIVAVIRDALRNPWQLPLLELVGGRPGSVVVDVGWPEGTSTPQGVPVVRTRGIAPGLMAATAALLRGRGDAR